MVIEPGDTQSLLPGAKGAAGPAELAGVPARRRSWSAALDLLCAGAVVIGVVLVAYWKVIDCETFMRLAIGRATVAEGPFLHKSLLLFSRPGIPWLNSEWLGDVTLYAVYSLTGEAGLVVFKLLVLAAGWLLVFVLGRRQGGKPLTLAALLLLTLLASPLRFVERVEMFVFLLIPVYGLILLRARKHGYLLWALIPAGVLWANVHGSFIVAWVLVGAATAEAWLGANRDPVRGRVLLAMLLIHLLLPLATPYGTGVYRVVLEHMRHGEFIKRAVVEWRPLDELPASTAHLPFHVLGILGLLSFLPRCNRRRVEGFLLFLAGFLLARSSHRFVLYFGMLAAGPIAANLHRAATEWRALAGRALCAMTVIIGVTAVILLVPVVKAAHAIRRAADQLDYPVRAARWLGQNAPPTSRLILPYTGSQWLMWEAPQVGLYIHPHVYYDMDFLERYMTEVMMNPAVLAQEIARYGINLAMTQSTDATPQLLSYLERTPDWRLVYFDGFYGIYARNVDEPEAQQAFRARYAYRALRGVLSFDYLLASPKADIEYDMNRLRIQAPAVAQALSGFQILRSLSAKAGPGEDPSARRDAEHAAALLTEAIGHLPGSPALWSYLIEALLLAGDKNAAGTALAQGLQYFPQSRRLHALRALMDARM